MKISQKVTVISSTGLNVLACVHLQDLSRQFNCELTIGKGPQTASMKSLLGLLTVASPKGTELEITAEGDDAETALFAISNFFRSRFGEEE